MIIPNMDFGGAQRSFAKLSESLSSRYNIYLVVFNRKAGVAYDFKGELIDLDILASSSIVGKAANFIKRIQKVTSIKREKNIDISISFLEGADYINLLSKKKEKVILSIRGSKIHDETTKGLLGWFRNFFLIPYLYKYADKIVTVNYGIIYELSTYYKLSPLKQKVIYNAYDIDAILKLSQQEDEEFIEKFSNKPYILFSGRLAIEKGIDKLIRVYHRLKEREKTMFVIIGSGPQEIILKNLCLELGLKYFKPFDKGSATPEESEIVFLGEQNNPYRYLSKALLFMMASSSEGFPNSLVEAMICGAPVITTDCPWGPREILAGTTDVTKKEIRKPEYTEYGILMPMFDKQDTLEEVITIWVNLVERTIGDEKLRESYSLRGRLRAEAFSYTKNLELWIQAIED
ncbi:MAG TPA: glycosyltransferase [Cytophagaceae bacterium]|nr:glycosyltransferase [Cytophagaceae bacterium]